MQRTPVKPRATSGANTKEDNLIPLPILYKGQQEIIHVSQQEHDYLSEVPQAQQHEYLQRKFTAQQTAQAENLINFQEANLDQNAGREPQEDIRTNSPTPTDKSLEDIRERTRIMEETLSGRQQEQNTEVKKPPTVEKDEDKNNACRDRQHEFEQRTKTYLAAPAKKFLKAVNTLIVQLNRGKFADEVSKQYGDELLKDVHDLYEVVEEAREYCLEVLNGDERIQKEEYLHIKFEEKCACERIHRKYFEQQEENKRWRQQHQPPPAPGFGSNTSPRMSTPFPQHTKPPFRPSFDQDQGRQGQHTGHQDQGHQGQYTGHQDQGHQGQYKKRPQTGFNDYGQQGTHYGQSQQRHPGFNIFEDQEQGSRIPTPVAPSVIERHHHTRYKLNEELSLVEKWDGAQPRAYMAFRAQWANFYEKMVKEQRPSLDLYYALLKVLTGSANDLVQTKYPNNQSYAQAIKKLDDLFYNPTNLLRDMVQNLLKTRKMVDTYDSLLAGMTKLLDAWNDLDQADLTKDQLKGLLFIAATEKNLSDESWKCWIDVQNDPRFKQNPMEAFEISAYLGSINKAMLNAQKRKNALGSKEDDPRTQFKTGKKQSTLFGSYSNTVQSKPPSQAKVQQQARGPNNTCITCSGNPHKYQLNCPKLKEMTANQVYRIMTNFGIECQMCLGLGHRTPNCPPTREGLLKKCSIKEDGQECQRYHCRALHKPKRTYEEPKGSSPPKQE